MPDERNTMTTVHCAFPKCNIVGSISEDVLISGMWYCQGHRWALSMTDRELAVHIARREKAHNVLRGKFIITLTDEQIAELENLLETRNTGRIVPAPTVLQTDHIRDLERMVDIAMKALDRISNDPDEEIDGKYDGEIREMLEQIAQDAIDAIRKLRNAY